MNYPKTYSEAINRAIDECLYEDQNLLCSGLGINDPKGIFGTTIDLKNKHGEERVFDTPTSENAITGIGIGAAIGGHPIIMTHQRLDFFLLAMDQLVNSAAKWYFMFGDQTPVPITIRVILGRGWGQGPTHCQNLHAWFAHIPGLKVVMPTFANDAYALLKESIKDPNPVIFMEHRWLHGNKWNKDNKEIATIGKSKICKSGQDITIVASSYLTIEALKAAKFLSESYNIECEILDLRSIKPLDIKEIERSTRKTKRLLVLDSGHEICGMAADIVARISKEIFYELRSPPSMMTMGDMPEPTSYFLTKDLYITSSKITSKVLGILGKEENPSLGLIINEGNNHDIPGDWFKGPF